MPTARSDEKSVVDRQLDKSEREDVGPSTIHTQAICSTRKRAKAR